MNITYQVYLISDSTGETIDRIFLALKVYEYFQNSFKSIKMLLGNDIYIYA